MVVIELKKPGVPARTAFDENLTHYKQQIPALPTDLIPQFLSGSGRIVSKDSRNKGQCIANVITFDIFSLSVS